MDFNIVPRQFDGETIQTVNARDLHAALCVGSQFKDWISRRVSEYSFEEGKDFCSFLSESSGGRPSKEFAISIEMAKELAMVERTDQGREARRYFIECEKRLKATPTTANHLSADIYTIGAIADVMRVSESGRLGMVRSFVESNAPRLLPVLPAYAIDAPTTSGNGSSEPTTTITEIARKIGMSAARANLRLESMGLIEKLERKSSSGKTKFYWSVTGKGLGFGKNVTNPANQLETQPHWYLNKEDDIISMIYLLS